MDGQKLVKNNQDNEIQNITLWNMYFSNKIYKVKGLQGMSSLVADVGLCGIFFFFFYVTGTNGVWGKSPRRWGVFENFCVKSTHRICKVVFNCKLREKIGGWGSRMY